MNLHSCQDDLVNDGGGAAQEAEFFAEQEQREKHEEMVASSNKKVYPISAPQPIGCFKHEEGVSCSRDFGPKFRCGKIPCEFIFHRTPI